MSDSTKKKSGAEHRKERKLESQAAKVLSTQLMRYLRPSSSLVSSSSSSQTGSTEHEAPETDPQKIQMQVDVSNVEDENKADERGTTEYMLAHLS